MKLSDKVCKNAKTAEKPYKLADGQGLYLLVTTEPKCKRCIAADLKDALVIAKTGHFAAIEAKDLPQFLKTLESNKARQ